MDKKLADREIMKIMFDSMQEVDPTENANFLDVVADMESNSQMNPGEWKFMSGMIKRAYKRGLKDGTKPIQD